MACKDKKPATDETFPYNLRVGNSKKIAGKEHLSGRKTYQTELKGVPGAPAFLVLTDSGFNTVGGANKETGKDGAPGSVDVMRDQEN
jgi:hypothetical protein